MDMSHKELPQTSGSRSGRGSIAANEIKKTKKNIGRHLYENGVDINDVDQCYLQRMIPNLFELTLPEIPTREELKGWIFQDAMAETNAYVDEIKNSWVRTGCSILLDGWIDATDRYLVNVLTDCPGGTIYMYSTDITEYLQDMDAMIAFLSRIVTKVGEENVVQVITSSTSSFMKEVGKQFMVRFPLIFWAVGASDCIQLMLKRMGRMPVVGGTLEMAGIITRFIRSHPNVLKVFQDNGKEFDYPSKIKSIESYLILEDLFSEKETLMRISNSFFTLGEEGRRVADLVEDRTFWGNAWTVLKGVFPLAKVLELLDKGNKEQVGLIYETMEQVKETIKHGFGNRDYNYEPFWEEIDRVWNKHLHTSLHIGGYFFNPAFFYSSDFHIDKEVVTGLVSCLTHASKDHNVHVRISKQLESYQTKEGAFRVGSSAQRRSDISPANWWSRYGTECMDLQRFAVRILSQTCDAGSRFRLRRSAVEKLFNVGIDQREQQRLDDMVYLFYNMKLQKI